MAVLVLLETRIGPRLFFSAAPNAALLLESNGISTLRMVGAGAENKRVIWQESAESCACAGNYESRMNGLHKIAAGGCARAALD